jgi:hypothetical protein
MFVPQADWYTEFRVGPLPVAVLAQMYVLTEMAETPFSRSFTVQVFQSPFA